VNQLLLYTIHETAPTDATPLQEENGNSFYFSTSNTFHIVEGIGSAKSD